MKRVDTFTFVVAAVMLLCAAFAAGGAVGSTTAPPREDTTHIQQCRVDIELLRIAINDAATGDIDSATAISKEATKC